MSSLSIVLENAIRQGWAISRTHGELLKLDGNPGPGDRDAEFEQFAVYLGSYKWCRRMSLENSLWGWAVTNVSPTDIQVRLSVSHTRRGVAGMSMWRNPTRRWRASTIALMTAGGAPTAPASPAPLTPSGLAVEGTLWVEKAKNGTSSARGMA